MALVKRYYKDRLPPKIKKLVRWLIVRSLYWDSDSFDDIEGRTEYMTFQLSFSKAMIVIDKTTKGYITFQLELEHE